MGASEQAAERAIIILKRAIDAAENSNQAGEDFVVAAAAGPELLAMLERARTRIDSMERDSGNAEDSWLTNKPTLLDEIDGLLAKASGTE